MKAYVWDTGALVQFFAGNEEAVKKMKLMEQNKAMGYIPQLVFSEFYYKTWQKLGRQPALLRIKILRDSFLQEYILNEVDTLIVGKAKIEYSFLSMIDAIVVATAKSKKATVLTTDSDFLKIKDITTFKIKY